MDKDLAVDGLSSIDWKEIQLALVQQMITAVEHPSDVNQNVEYYEKLADTADRIASKLYKKERNWE